MTDWLAFLAASPTRQLMPHRLDCNFQFIYHPHIHDNIEYSKVFPNNERIFPFIQNEHLNPRELYP
jgi:hypothetical protein